METWEGLLLAIGWFLLRFGVPILGTLLIVYFFTQKQFTEGIATTGLKG